MNTKEKIILSTLDLASKYGIMSIPTLLIIKNGEVASQFVGLTPKSKIEESF